MTINGLRAKHERSGLQQISDSCGIEHASRGGGLGEAGEKLLADSALVPGFQRDQRTDSRGEWVFSQGARPTRLGSGADWLISRYIIYVQLDKRDGIHHHVIKRTLKQRE